MFSMIRKRLTFANVAMTLALVLAMSGGAYAAGKYLITSTKQISPKVLKSLKGANGANGAAGAQGLQGAVGAKGETGAAGKNGEKGETGTPGKNGANGAAGAAGSPWTAGGTLPKGSSEHGTWTINGRYKEGDRVYASISFPVPLTAALPEAQVHYIHGPNLAEFSKKEFPSPPAGCKGNYEAPEAEEGNLCMFQTLSGKLAEEAGLGKFGELRSVSLADPGRLGISGASVSGSFLNSEAEFKAPETEGNMDTYGVWVVTG
jgi:hypothetical protein